MMDKYAVEQLKYEMSSDSLHELRGAIGTPMFDAVLQRLVESRIVESSQVTPEDEPCGCRNCDGDSACCSSAPCGECEGCFDAHEEELDREFDERVGLGRH